MFIEAALLAAGIAPGYLLRRSRRIRRWTGCLSLASIDALLFILGVNLGSDAVLLESLGRMGAQACILGLVCTLGSALGVCMAGRLFRDQAGASENRAKAESGDGKAASMLRKMSGSLCILACFVAGLGVGGLGILPPWLYAGDITLHMVRLMLFCVGLGLGFDLRALLLVRDLGWRAACIPALTLLGTMLGALLCVPLLDFATRTCLAAGAGMGYYSLSSVIITSMEGAASGSLALLSNMFREIFCLLAAPLLTRLLGPLALVAAAGSPGMDTCLPVVARFAGERFAILALFNGLILTMLTPVLIPFILG